MTTPLTQAHVEETTLTLLSAPTASEIEASSHWVSIDFLSDLHLSLDLPRTFDAWVEHMDHTDADAVFLLGDLVEAWVGDDSRFDGFDARFADALRSAASRRPTYFMVGNRDFLVGPEMLNACGVKPLADPTVLTAFGQRVLLVHGDELCLEDAAYQRVRQQVRNPIWQSQVLAQPLAARRAAARELRQQSRQAGMASGEWADIDVPTAVHWLRQTNTQTLLHGHTHRPATQTLAPGFTRHVLSDWDLDQPSAPRAEVLRWTAAGFERQAPARSH